MPKAGNSKKRKRESKKDEDYGAKKAKSKENDGPHEEQEQDCTVVTNLSCEEQQEIDDIDEKLEQNAAKNNLTTINVKSILHHVVSDKRVLAMVKSVAAELEDEQSDAATSSNIENLDVELDFAPKMTRAKSKQTNQGDPIAVLASQSPIKELRTKRTSTKKKIHFTELELPDSSSDEEYNPDNEEDGSDEDTESCVSFTSDLASPQVPGTPEREKTDDTKPSEENTEKTVTRSLSKKLSEEPFKVPYPVASTASTPVEEVISTKQKSLMQQKKTPTLIDSLSPSLLATFPKITVVEKSDLIAKRTRSQLPLQDIPIESIEATFQPPDFTADMYDTIKEDDLDFEDIEWQKWLQGLINSDDVCGDEDHEDSEYNFMAEDQKEEKEEYRNDRAVRIPKKEVNELLDELLKDYDDSEDTLWLDDESEDMGYLEMLNVRDAVDKKVQFFNVQQLERLTEQLQQHAQLLAQIFVMAREDDSLSKEAQLTQDYVNELKGFHERASNAQLIRGLGDGKVHASAFSFPGLEQAVEIVNSTFVPKRRTSSPRKCTTPKKDNKSPAKTGRRSKTLTEDLLPPLSETNIQLMATKKNVFRFVELLPHHSLLPRTGDTPKQLNGLRVKFSDAEDNLLALGMKQLGKKWDLIQEHLLPVKSPKQLQIRCKNLLSARAPENIIKYYRRNKELWHLPTKIQVYVESNGRRVRGRDAVEPDWLINYKKKQKERRDSQERNQAFVFQQSIESSSYSRPIVPKLSGGAYTVALPSGSSPSDRGQVAWVTITSSQSTWKALTPTQVVEDACERDNTLLAGNMPSVRSAPTISVGKDTVKQTSEDHAQLPAPASATEADVDANMNPSPANDEPVLPTHETTEIKTPTATITTDDSKPSSANSNPKEISKENASKDSTEKATSEGSTNKPTTSSKAKPSRDKNGGSVTGSRVTSKSHNSGSESGGNAGGSSRKPAPSSQAGWAGNYILEPDPKFRNRAHAFAEGFLTKVKKQLIDDPATYEEFLRTLALSSAEQCSPVELYKRVEVVLAQYPGLVEDFVGFLEPDQAVEAGVFMANLEFVRARTFLRKLEVHFQRSPSQFRKIINAFDSWNKKTMKDPLQLQQTIVPMLKGQMHLIEEFYSFFDDLKPPVCSDDDFEEIEFGSGSEPEVDDFEEVVIPCFVEPKKIKGRPSKDTLQKNSNTRKARKPGATVKGAKQQGTNSKPIGNRTKVSQTKTSTCGKDQTKASGKQDDLQGKGQGDNVTKDMKSTPEESTNVETTRKESGVGDQRTEISVLEGPLSVTTSLQSETSNDSYRGEELNPSNTDTLNLEHEEERERRHSDSEEQEDDGNSDMEHDGYEEDDDDDYVDGDDIDVDVDVIKSDVDAEASGCDSDANVVSSSAVVPAKNLQRSQDGQVVLLWTREDDRVILQACQKMGAKPETFEHIASGLKNKTAGEVKTRFLDLLNLFKASSGERTRESTNEESGSEEDDEEDSETVGESEGEQPRD